MESIYENYFTVGYGDININTLEISDLGLLKIFQEMACSHASIFGYGLNDIPNTHLTWLVLGWKFKIIKRPVYTQKILVKTWPRKSVKSIYYRDFELFSESGEKLCVATSKWVLVNTDTHALVSQNEDIFKKFAPNPVTVLSDEIKKIPVPDTFQNSVEYKILRRDIDTNDHVNNTIYLSLAYECLPEEVYKKLDFNLIEIVYKHECILNDTVLINYSATKNGFIVAIKNKYNDNLHAVIKYSNEF